MVQNIKAPTLIIHGTDDVCFSLEHAVLLNKAISNSKLETIDDMGHMFSLSQANTVFYKICELINY
jgi:pimeloyl-ACP methyl ester carboxylesterase